MQESPASLQESFFLLLSVMDELREKCPWDRKQTIQSLRPMTIEETYELGDAILKADWNLLKEELGDLFLHIIFYVRIAREENKFTLEDVLKAITEKLIIRHPHIYGDVEVRNEEEVKKNWEKLKLKEGKESVLSGVPVGLPALVKAIRIQEKVKQVGFEWDHREQVYEKIMEELQELQVAVKENDASAMEEELGDLLFSVVNYARFLKVDADSALERTNLKFINRFQLLEKEVRSEGKNLQEMSLEEMDELWNAIKKRNKENSK
jgi:XTP/dITP diphosphohydrolase